MADFNPVYYVNKLIEASLEKKASDIHIHPTRQNAFIKLRLDGDLQSYESISRDFFESVVNRLKVMSNLGTNVNNAPSDGRFEYVYNEQKRDFRISLIPSLFGDSIVIRILLLKDSIPSLLQLGMNKETLSHSAKLLEYKEGLILATGATGSGKTTTMYALLKELLQNRSNIHIISIEDPIEYEFEEFTQIQVNEAVGLSFPVILRSVLRHDPDIILVGEIRDQETAEIAIRASLTGHLVFATMHTNDTEGAISRFLDFGISPILLCDSLKAVYNQSLNKAVCKNCGGNGCDSCAGLGYSGRIASFELLQIDWKKKQEIKTLAHV